jgi:hypothetical protein
MKLGAAVGIDGLTYDGTPSRNFAFKYCEVVMDDGEMVEQSLSPALAHDIYSEFVSELGFPIKYRMSNPIDLGARRGL